MAAPLRAVGDFTSPPNPNITLGKVEDHPLTPVKVSSVDEVPSSSVPSVVIEAPTTQLAPVSSSVRQEPVTTVRSITVAPTSSASPVTQLATAVGSVAVPIWLK